MGLEFTPVLSGRQVIGSQCLTADAHFFFGTIHASVELLNQMFPQYRFAFLRQVHGNEVINAQPAERPTADGQWTMDRKIALTIQTADCLPVLFANSKQVCAVHAGWRGVVSGISAKAAQLMAQQGETLSVAIGPHIQFQNFEVGLDVADTLSQAWGKTNSPEFIKPHREASKRLVNLSAIVQKQISEFAQPSFHLPAADTLTDALYHSYRRGKDQAARNYSFVARV